MLAMFLKTMVLGCSCMMLKSGDICAQEEDIQNAVDFLYNEVLNKQYLLNSEYKTSGLEYVTLVTSKDDSKDDIVKLLISNGLVQAEGRKEKHLSKLVSEYKKAEEKAKESRVCHVYVALFVQTSCSLWHKGVLLQV